MKQFRIISEPNLFEFATSELSQDAFFAWLLSWGNTNANPGLRQCALDLLREWTSQPMLEFEGEKSIQVSMQHEKIDLLILVNQKYLIVIEDKTSSGQHSNQLARYKEAVSENFNNFETSFIYLKTGNDCAFSYYLVDKNIYRPFTRSELLRILTPERSANHIYQDYVAYLDSLQKETALPISEKTGYSERQLQGYFMRIEKELQPENSERIRFSWHQVPNRANSFWAFTFGWRDFDGYQLYWQFEFHPDNSTRNRLVSKMHVQDEAKVAKKEIKKAVLKAFLSVLSEGNVRLQKAERSGKNVTLFEWQIPNLYPDTDLSVELAVGIVEKGTNVIDAVSL